MYHQLRESFIHSVIFNMYKTHITVKKKYIRNIIKVQHQVEPVYNFYSANLIPAVLYNLIHNSNGGM